MHILIIPSWYPTYEGDFSGSFFREQAIGYKKEFSIDTIGVIYQHFYSVKKIGKKLCIDTVDDGVNTIIECSISIPKFRVINYKRARRSYNKLFDRYVAKYGKPDILHVHSALPAGIAALSISKKHNIPYVVTEHSSAYARKTLSNKQLNKSKFIFNKSVCNLAVSRPFSCVLQNQFYVNFDYVPNSVHEDFFSDNNIGEKEGLAFNFLSVAGLDMIKGFDILIKAYVKAFADNKYVKLNIVGDGVCRQDLERLVNTYNMQEKIKFLGKLSRLETMEQMQKANAFVLASRYETFGVVFVEALATGIPAIATKCGGPESIITDDVGILVEKENVEELASAMIKIYEDRKSWENKSDDIKKYCRDNFSQKVVAIKYNDIYKKVVSMS
ncbi:glycosyltransferase [Francisellaceae bacterium CB52]